MEDKFSVLRRYFGYTEFRSGQEKIVDALSGGRDVLCVMPTGAGKSICYQVPALLLPGITIVISPLISLMKDQVEALEQNGVSAAFLNSSMTPQQYMQTLELMERGEFRIVYVAPERLSTDSFRAACENIRVSLVAVDEAHCVSQWGQDFRPEYRKIADFVNSLELRPIVGAFTATATKTVREDISSLLELKNPILVTTGFDRPNLYFGVTMPNSKPIELLRLIEERQGKCGIIYCSTRKAVEDVDELLRAKGIDSTRYHAGLSEEERRRNQEDFIYDRCSVMVATNAFGMGIDKSNVAFVIHYNMPKNLESYYQEAGRAGRDGSLAECILMYGKKDVQTNRWLIENSEPNPELDPDTQEEIIQRDLERLKQMTYYCTSTGCLRKHILGYFGEKSGDHCGNCSGCAAGSALVDGTVWAQQALSCVVRCGQSCTSETIVEVLHGEMTESVAKSGYEQLSTFGLMRDMSVWDIRRVLDALLLQGYLKQTDSSILKITPEARAILLGGKKFELRVPVAPQEKQKAAAAPDMELFQRLKQLRSKLASRSGVPAYVVFTDATLTEMCAEKPRTEQQLMKISGVGEKKAEKYGKAFLKAIDEYASETSSGEARP